MLVERVYICAYFILSLLPRSYIYIYGRIHTSIHQYRSLVSFTRYPGLRLWRRERALMKVNTLGICGMTPLKLIDPCQWFAGSKLFKN